MPVMNFDLEDGLPPVSFSLKTVDCERFMKFMAECQAIKDSQKPAQQKPVAWRYTNAKGVYRYCKHRPNIDMAAEYAILEPIPLYTSPPASKPLTDEFILSLHYGCSTSLKFARAIEAAHGIKE